MKLCYCKTSIFNIYQSWARNNSVATMWPWFQGTKLFVVAILLYLLWLPYQDTVAYNYFSNFFWSLTGPWGSVTLSRCCCHEAKKLLRAQLCYKVTMTSYCRVQFDQLYMWKWKIKTIMERLVTVRYQKINKHLFLALHLYLHLFCIIFYFLYYKYILINFVFFPRLELRFSASRPILQVSEKT